MSANPQSEAYVPIASDGAGDKKLRALLGYVLQSDGSMLPVYSQVVALTDSNGNVIDLSEAATVNYQEAIVERLDTIICLMEKYLDQL
jgi:hypothetical protein